MHLVARRLLPIALVALAIGLAALTVVPDHSTDSACPRGSRSVHPTVIHLSPTLIQHQNWVGIPPSEIESGQVLYICADGRAIGRAVMDNEDVASPVVILDVPTRWADAAWLSGSLDQYDQSERWQIVFPPFEGSP